MRQSRKAEHLKIAAGLSDGPANNCFADFSLLHNCLPEIHWQDMQFQTAIAGIPLVHPVLINAITGGSAAVESMNGRLAELAKYTQSAMAVGSQYAGLQAPEVQSSYTVVRKVNPHGVIFANLGAYVKPDEARRAVDMIGAQAIQLHLNPAQEIMMAEGDRSCYGYLRNIARIVQTSSVPVIVKEVGCGMAREQAQALLDVGVAALDSGGAGGTNFLSIEAARKQTQLADDWLTWGIPTALSAVELAELGPNVEFIVSGGIRTPLEAVKALALGAKAVGMAAPFIKMLDSQSLTDTAIWLEGFLKELKKFMFLTGSVAVSDLRRIPLVITGYSQEWLRDRGIDTKKYAVRSKSMV